LEEGEKYSREKGRGFRRNVFLFHFSQFLPVVLGEGGGKNKTSRRLTAKLSHSPANAVTREDGGGKKVLKGQRGGRKKEGGKGGGGEMRVRFAWPRKVVHFPGEGKDDVPPFPLAFSGEGGKRKNPEGGKKRAHFLPFFSFLSSRWPCREKEGRGKNDGGGKGNGEEKGTFCIHQSTSIFTLHKKLAEIGRRGGEKGKKKTSSRGRGKEGKKECVGGA